MICQIFKLVKWKWLVFALQTTAHTLHVRFMFLGLFTEEQIFVRWNISKGQRFKRMQIGCNIFNDMASLVPRALLCGLVVFLFWFCVFWFAGFLGRGRRLAFWFFWGIFLSRLNIRSWCWKLSFFLFSTLIYTSSCVISHISLRGFWFGLDVWWCNTLSLTPLLAGSVMIFSSKNHFIGQIL